MKMNVALSLLLSLFLLIPTSNAFDITHILNNYPEFSTFSSYLNQYNLAPSINSRQTITVLAVDNGNLSPVSSYPPDVIKNILSVHVILDYYDVTKLQQLSTGSSLLTTLFQASGLAKGQQGYLNVTHVSATSVMFSSAMPGSTQGSSLVKSVVTQPYNISILQVSNVIIPQGIDGTKTSSPPSVTPSTPSATPPPPPPPAPATTTATPPPLPSPATATTTPPPSPATTTATPPPPPAPAKTTATPPTKSSMAPPPTPTKATPPTTSSTATPPTTSTATSPSSSPPTSSQSPSAPPGSATEPGTLAPESPTKDVPAADNKPSFKSAAASIETGAALICTMALSSLYLGSRI